MDIMKITLGTKEQIKDLAERYVVLELDTFKVKGEEIPSWCVVDAGDIGLGEMTELQHWQEQHANLIKNYKQGDWNFCEQMVEHLQGKFGGNLDSFYTELYSRLKGTKPEPYTYVIEKDI